ncbi:hypothetical protein JYU34_022186 [Plutella xylostella]|uniref:Uncharacterized protein n=1 Tax=Plutella xylostella TaxID=51655 RepID=A0ABQ7PQG8_PLUXY|nr:hypothetical protein JYU34_022186 [Plutella xylostella]
MIFIIITIKIPSAATSIATPASPSGGSAHYVLAPSTRITSNNTIVTKKGNLQSPMATHV